MSASNAGLEHSPAPYRNFIGLTQVVNLLGLGEAAHPAHLDVDDAAGAGLNGGSRVANMADGFVQANCCPQLALQARVIVDIVIP